MHTRKVEKDDVIDELLLLGDEIEGLDISADEMEQKFKYAIIEQLMSAAMMAEIDVWAVRQLAESYRMKIEMMKIIRADNYCTVRRGNKYPHYLLTEFGLQQSKYHKFLSAVGGTPMSRHSKSLSTYKLLGGAQKVPHGNSKTSGVLDILNDE